MTYSICDRCGDVTVALDQCRCHTAYKPVEVRRRLRDAFSRARATDAKTAPVTRPRRAA